MKKERKQKGLRFLVGFFETYNLKYEAYYVQCERK